MDDQLRAFADPTRREILQGLLKGEAAAGDIAAAFSTTGPAISHHLRVLNEAGLVTVRRRAQSRLYSINTEAVAALRAEFDDFWGAALPRLKTVIESDRRARRKRKKKL